LMTINNLLSTLESLLVLIFSNNTAIEPTALSSVVPLVTKVTVGVTVRVGNC